MSPGCPQASTLDSGTLSRAEGTSATTVCTDRGPTGLNGAGRKEGEALRQDSPAEQQSAGTGPSAGGLAVWGPAGIQLLGLDWAQTGTQCDRHWPRCFALLGPFSPKILKIVFYTGIGIETNAMFSSRSLSFPSKVKGNRRLCGSLKAGWARARSGGAGEPSEDPRHVPEPQRWWFSAGHATCAITCKMEMKYLPRGCSG